jgi:frataxin-like iron-binding protein CyaY
VEKAIKEMEDKMVIDVDIPGGVLKLMGEDGLKLLTHI